MDIVLRGPWIQRPVILSWIQTGYNKVLDAPRAGLASLGPPLRGQFFFQESEAQSGAGCRADCRIFDYRVRFHCFAGGKQTYARSSTETDCGTAHRALAGNQTGQCAGTRSNAAADERPLDLRMCLQVAAARTTLNLCPADSALNRICVRRHCGCAKDSC